MFVDGDLDGRADLFVVNGMVTGKNPREREIEFWNLMSSEYRKFEKGVATADFGDDSLWGRPPKRFYRNLDGRRFAEVAAVTGLESDANQGGLVVLVQPWPRSVDERDPVDVDRQRPGRQRLRQIRLRRTHGHVEHADDAA